jgi:hypothetical protein
MLKQFGIFFVILACVVALSVAAQTANETSPSPTGTATATTEPAATPTAAPVLDRQYPIAAGVWYPGDPLPTVPSRYYRVRCWPGCHSYGKYANPPKTDKSPKQ